MKQLDYLNEYGRGLAHDLCSKLESNFDEYKGRNVSKCEENIFNTAKSLPNPEEFINVLSKDVNNRLEVNNLCEKKYLSQGENALQNVSHRKEYLDSCYKDVITNRGIVDNNVYYALSQAQLWDKAFSMVDGNIMLTNLFLRLLQEIKNEEIVESKFEELSEYHNLHSQVIDNIKIEKEITKLIKDSYNVTIDIEKEDLCDSNLVFSFLFGTEKEISDDLLTWLKNLILSKKLTEIKQLVDSRNFNELIKPIVKKIIRASENNKFVPKISRISLEFKKACGKIVKEIPQTSISQNDIYDSYRLDFISLVIQGISAKEITNDLFKRVDLLIYNRQSEDKGWFNKIKTVLLAILPTSGGITEDNKRQEDLELLKIRVESIVSEAINSSMSSEVNNHMYSNNLSSRTNSNLKPILSPFTLIREPSLISNTLPSPVFSQISVEPVVNNTTMIS